MSVFSRDELRAFLSQSQLATGALGQSWQAHLVTGRAGQGGAERSDAEGSRLRIRLCGGGTAVQRMADGRWGESSAAGRRFYTGLAARVPTVQRPKRSFRFADAARIASAADGHGRPSPRLAAVAYRARGALPPCPGAAAPSPPPSRPLQLLSAATARPPFRIVFIVVCYCHGRRCSSYSSYFRGYPRFVSAPLLRLAARLLTVGGCRWWNHRPVDGLVPRPPRPRVAHHPLREVAPSGWMAALEARRI